MPCNSLATVSAQVAIDVRDALKSESALKQLCASLVSANLCESATPTLHSRGDAALFVRVAGSPVYISLDESGEVFVQAQSKSVAASLSSAVATNLAAVARLLMQAKIAQAVGKATKVKSASRVGSTVVLEVTL